jgi:hypothetical protein
LGGAAQNAAVNKSQRRCANVVEHAGLLVAGTTRLNAQAVQLLKPLVYFDPNEWDATARKDLVRDLILFADEHVVVPQMRASRTALQNLVHDIDDRDISIAAFVILHFANGLFCCDQIGLVLESASLRPRIRSRRHAA